MDLIIGGTGFLGSHLAAHLVKEKHDVAILKRPNNSLHETEIVFRYHFGKDASTFLSKINFVNGDLLDPFSLENAITDVSMVYNCSGFVSFNSEDRKKLFEINQFGQETLINVLLNSSIKKYCHVSSIGALGRNSFKKMMTDENAHFELNKQNTTYAISKYKGEIEAWRGFYEGLNTVIVNPGIILGAGDWNKGTCKLFKLVDNKLKFYTKGVNGYVDVNDVAKAIILLTNSDVSGQRYVLVSENISYQDLLIQISKELGKNPPAFYANYFLRKSVVLIDSIKHYLFGTQRTYSKQFATLAANVSTYSSNKFHNQFNFPFTPIAATIKDISRFYLAEKEK